MPKIDRELYKHTVKHIYWNDDMRPCEPKRQCTVASFCNGCYKIAIPKQCIRCKLRSNKKTFAKADSLWECSVCKLRYASSCATCIRFQREAHPQASITLARRVVSPETCCIITVSTPSSIAVCAVCNDELSSIERPNCLCAFCFSCYETTILQSKVKFKNVSRIGFVEIVNVLEDAVRSSIANTVDRFEEPEATKIVFLIMKYEGFVDNHHCLDCIAMIHECQQTAVHNANLLRSLQNKLY